MSPNKFYYFHNGNSFRLLLVILSSFFPSPFLLLVTNNVCNFIPLNEINLHLCFVSFRGGFFSSPRGNSTSLIFTSFMSAYRSCSFNFNLIFLRNSQSIMADSMTIACWYKNNGKKQQQQKQRSASAAQQPTNIKKTHFQERSKCTRRFMVQSLTLNFEGMVDWMTIEKINKKYERPVAPVTWW